MAVTVEGLPTVVLDDDYRIVEVNVAASPWFGQYLGEVIFDCYQGTEPLFRPHFDKARDTQGTVEFVQFYDGAAAHLTVVPSRGKLTVAWERIGVLDTFTLEGLHASLEKIVSKLQEAEDALGRNRVRDSLRVVTGGA